MLSDTPVFDLTQMIDKAASRIFKLSQDARKKGVNAPLFEGVQAAREWIDSSTKDTPSLLEIYRSELDVPFTISKTSEGSTDIFVLNQNKLESTNQILVYCLSFTSIINRGYTQLQYASLAAHLQIPVVGFHYPLYHGAKISHIKLNKLTVTSSLVAEFINTFSTPKEVSLIGNSQGALVAAKTAELIDSLHSVAHILALDPPTLRTGSAWNIFWRGIRDAGDFHERTFFPTPTQEVFDVVQDVYGEILTRLQALSDYAQKVFLVRRLTYLQDIANLDLLKLLDSAKITHPEVMADILYGSKSHVTGGDIYLNPRVQKLLDDPHYNDIQLHGIPHGTHAMMVNLEDLNLMLDSLKTRRNLSDRQEVA